MLHTSKENHWLRFLQGLWMDWVMPSLDISRKKELLTDSTLKLLKEKDSAKLGFKERFEIQNFLNRFTNTQTDKIDFSSITDKSEKGKAEEIYSLIKTIWAKEKISELSQELTQINKIPIKITSIRNAEQIQIIQDILKKVVVSWEEKDFSKLTPDEKALLSELFKDLRPYLSINKNTNHLTVSDERLGMSYAAAKSALKAFDAEWEVTKPVETVDKEWKPIDGQHITEQSVEIIDVRQWDPKEILTRRTFKLTPASEENEAQKKLIIEIQKKLIELWYMTSISETDSGSFNWETENAIARFMGKNNINWKASELTRWLALAILDSQVSLPREEKPKPEEKKESKPALEATPVVVPKPTPKPVPKPTPEPKKEDTVLATKLQKWAEKIPNEDVRNVQKLLKILDKDYQGGEDGLFGDKTEESLKRVLQNYPKKNTDSTKITIELITHLEGAASTKSRIVWEKAPQAAPQRLQTAPVRPRVFPRSRPVDISPKKQEISPRSWVDSSSLVPEKNFFEKIFSFSEDLETSKFTNLRNKIESTLSAKSGLETLEKQIFTISNSLDKGKIESVYTLAQQELWKKWIQLDSSLSPIEKAYVLQLVANALMWGKSMVERREKNRTNIKEYIKADRSQAREADKLFAQAFSWTMVKDIAAARNLAYQELSKIGTYKEMFLNNESGTYIFSVRSKNGMNWLQGYAGGSWEIVDIGVPYVRITEFEKRDVQKLISALNPVQLTLLRQQLKPVYWKLNDTQIISLLISGEKVWPQFIVKTPQGNITLELTFNKWGNCFNDAVWVHIETPQMVYNHDRRNGWNGTSGVWWSQSSWPWANGWGDWGGGNGGPGAWWSGR